MIPLLSPTMEINLLKEPWSTMDLSIDPTTTKTITTEEDNSVFSIWEENYQDLSGWCIDGFQGRCVFPTGEFETRKSCGTKSDGNDISTRKTGLIGQVSRSLLGDEEIIEGSSLKVPELAMMEAETESHLGEGKSVIKSELTEHGSIDTKEILLLNTIDSSKDQGTNDWIQLANDSLPNASPFSIQQESMRHQTNNNVIRTENPVSISQEVTKKEEYNWDTINAFDNAEAEPFDLLSYLCDDNIQSPEGSVVSRESGLTIGTNSSTTGHVDETSSSTTTNLRREERSKRVRRDYATANASSASSSIAAISAALDSVAEMSERSSRDKAKHNSRSMRNNYDVSVVKGRGKKRYMDSDSEDRASDGSYRESREKNNEASRKSRQNKKAKENEMKLRANELERDNRILKMKVEELDKLVTSMRTAILRSALNKRF